MSGGDSVVSLNEVIMFLSGGDSVVLLKVVILFFPVVTLLF